jgi:MFS family permease
MGIYSAAAIVLQPLVGRWVDRLGRRPFQAAGAVLLTLASLAFALTERLGPLFPLLRILQGIGHSLFFVSSYTRVADLVPPGRRGQAMGIFGLFGLVSTAVAPTLGELVIHAFGFRVFFLSTAAVGLSALLVTVRLRESAPLLGGAPRPGSADRPLTLATRALVPMLLGGSFGMSHGTLFTFLPTYGRALAVPSLAFFYLAYTLAALLVRALGGRLIDRLGARIIIGPALAGQALGIMVLASLSWLPSPVGGVGLVLVGGLTGAAHGFVYPALTIRIMDLWPESLRGQVVGWFGAMTLLGGAVGAIVFGYVVQGAGYPIMFLLLAGLLWGNVALALLLDR